MRFKSLPVLFVAALSCAQAAEAQSRPPAELPPADFAGQQYVDSRGCVYARAGHGGQVSWVARIDRSRKALCGATPSLTTMAQARSELAAAEPAKPVAAPPVQRMAESAPVAPTPRRAPAAAPAPKAADYVPPPVSYGKPLPLGARPVAGAALPVVVSNGQIISPPPSSVAAPVIVAQPVAIAPAHVGGGSAPPATIGGHPTMVNRNLGCPQATPHGVWYELRDGRRTLLCSNMPHRLEGVSPAPIQGPGRAGDRVVAQRYAPVHTAAPRGHAEADPPMMGGTGYRVAYADPLMVPPPGYKPAWQDGRLNPARAQGTANGAAQMDQVWTRQVPARLQPGAPAGQSRATLSTRSTPAAVAGARFVQVGSFGQPENASRAASRLQALGLPVHVNRTTLRGKPVQVVKAGPFASDAEAAQALSAARGAGFNDAILRR